MLMHAKEPPMTTSAKQLLASISLNNIGVDLLEKHCFHQALETFSDAVAVLKTVDKPQPPPTQQDDRADCFIDTAAKLHRAAERLKNPEVITFTSNHVVQVYSSNDGNLSGLSLPSLVPHATAYPKTYSFPLRIDHIEVKDHIQRYMLKLTALAVVRNCSVTYQCIAVTGGSTVDNEWEDRWYKHAMKGLVSVQTGIEYLTMDQQQQSQQENQQEGGDSSLSCTDHDCDYFTLLVALVFHDVCVVSVALGNDNNALLCHMQLARIVQEGRVTTPSLMEWRNAAAA